MVIIWPLRQVMAQTVFMQQRPRWTGGRRIPVLPTLPWLFKDRPPVIGFYRYDLPPIAVGRPTVGRPTVGRPAVGRPAVGRPTVVHRLMPPPVTWPLLSGVTRDSTGAVLGNCAVELMLTESDVKVDKVVSSATGDYSFKSGRYGKAYYIVAYKAGSPDVAGTTVNTLVAV